MTAPAGYALRAMEASDYDDALALWQSCAGEGIGLNESDTRPAIEGYLARNPGLSQVIRTAHGQRLVGAVLCGHDGRRGYLHHLAVAADHRRRGLARSLVQAGLEGLHHLGIPKCNLFLYSDNHAGRAFWIHEGWAARDDLVVIQRGTDSPPPPVRP